MADLYTHINERPLLYVARDVERALGLAPAQGYFVVTNSSVYATEMRKKYPSNILLIEAPEPLDTYSLLTHPVTRKWIDKNSPRILVFKNEARIEKYCRELGLELLNPAAKTASMIESKVSQVEWLGELASLLPGHSVTTCEALEWKGAPYVIAFDHGHTGTGTLLIDAPEKLDELKRTFPKRPVRTTAFVDGPMYTMNVVVTKDRTLVSTPSLQITGIAPFTHNAFSTVGNDWNMGAKLTEAQSQALVSMAEKIGAKMLASGWKGLFGIDIKSDRSSGKLYLIEINARQPASTTFESELQTKAGGKLTTFEAHVLSLLSKEISGEISKIHDGAQIIKRVDNAARKYDTERLKELDLNVIVYDNKEPGADAVRVQSTTGIMANDSEFNELGKKIAAIFS